MKIFLKVLFVNKDLGLRVVFFSLLSLALVSQAQAFKGKKYCQKKAQKVARELGGTGKVFVLGNDVEGFGANKTGEVSYTFKVGNRQCYVDYYVFGTYFNGTRCRERPFFKELGDCHLIK